MFSFENNVLPALRYGKSRSFYDIREISLGCAVLLALRRPAGNFNSVHLRPPHLAASEGHTGTFNTGGALDDVQPRAAGSAVWPVVAGGSGGWRLKMNCRPLISYPIAAKSTDRR